MKPGLDQLEAVLWIAKLGSFRGAASRLNISQPAISSRIRELEDQLGFGVIDRSSYKPRMTVEGQEVVRYAEQMIALAESFRTRFLRERLLPRSIKMGAADTFALTYLSPLLERLAVVYPHTQIELDIDFSSNLDRKLQKAELDIAFLTAPAASEAVHSEPLVRLELAWVASPKLALQQKPLAAADLLALPIITNPRPSHLYQTVMDWFSAGGYVPPRIHTCTSLTIMIKLAVDNFGISILPLILIQQELMTGRLVRIPIHHQPSSHYIATAFRTDKDREAHAAIASIARGIVDENQRL